jgi:NADH:ubiquinone oxidoreductase subunit K
MCTKYLITYNIMFILGMTGILWKRQSIFLVLFSIELMYVAIIGMYLLSSQLMNLPIAQFYGLLILITAASESAVGLGILITIYHWGRNLIFYNYGELRT